MNKISYAEIYDEEMIVTIRYEGKEIDMFIDDFNAMCHEYVESTKREVEECKQAEQSKP